MTKLDIESYCHDCPEISPIAEIIKVDQLGSNPRYVVSIVCEHRARCGNMCEKIKKQTEGDRP